MVQKAIEHTFSDNTMSKVYAKTKGVDEDARLSKLWRKMDLESNV
ncbi:hypothetical protein GCM10010965_30210 [Caldalkalibacillus thermarum]|nr:hypothetical protein GCM10010965_30210 [Caldalkalibacillus thermarum]